MPGELDMLAGALLITGTGIVWWQRRAVTCPRHRRWAGRAAWALADLCFAGAAVLLSRGFPS